MSKKELDHLYLTKNERMGILILFTLLLLFIIIPWLYNKKDTDIFRYSVKDINELTAIQPKDSGIILSDKDEFNKADKERYKLSGLKNNEPFEFDPNHLSLQDARKLGIADKSYYILQKYLGTGAEIRTDAQFGKIYGIDETTYKRLQPFIRFKNAKSPVATKVFPIYRKAKKINMNTAELDELISLPGIGDKLAGRIIKYRNLLGGFVSSNQIREVYGLQDSVINKIQDIVFVEGKVNKIHLNTIHFDSLKLHPYFGPKFARIICEYRKQHSGFTSKSDLYKLEALDSSWIHKVSDYLSFE